ncbi:MAG: cupredoxin domain-containing protein [Candidatus Diapherotrites archaeon]
MSKKILFGSVALLIFVWIIFLFAFSFKPVDSEVIDNSINSAFDDSKAVDVYLRALNNGSYDKQEIVVKKGIPVRLHFSADRDAGCGRVLVIYGINVRAISKSGETQVVTFIPDKEGVFEYSCAMRMWNPGKLVVKA